MTKERPGFSLALIREKGGQRNTMTPAKRTARDRERHSITRSPKRKSELKHGLEGEEGLGKTAGNL